MTNRARLLMPIAACVLALACGGQAPQATSGHDSLHERAACKVGETSPRPLVVEWPTELRADLEARAKRGVVVVRYEGCRMQVLEQCKAPGSYRYVAVSPKAENVHITNERELYATLPIGAAGLEGNLRSEGRLDIDMTLVGKWSSDRAAYDPDDLRGACEGATHVLTGLSVGAFTFTSGESNAAGAGFEVASVGLGAKSAASEKSLMHDGDIAACSSATSADSAPPLGCAALIRIDTMPIGAAPDSSEDDAIEVLKRAIQVLQLAPIALPIPPELADGARDQIVDAYRMVGKPASAHSFFKGYFREQSTPMLAELTRAYLREGKIAEAIIVAEDLADQESESACSARPPEPPHPLEGVLKKRYDRLLAHYCDLCGCVDVGEGS
jgi:hypothetical protein